MIPAGAAAPPPAPPSVRGFEQRKAVIAAAAPRTITIVGPDSLLLDRTPVAVQNISDVLKRRFGDDAAHQTFYIRIDTRVKYATFMAVLSAMQKAGFYKISLITENQP